jgi:hypothetical protein
MMKKGGKADMHEDAAQDRAMIKKAMAGKKFATGGVVNGQGGFANGGIIKSTKGETKMVTTKPDHSPAKTGGVKEGNGGGYATGGVVNGQGGYKNGGKVAANGIIKNESGAATATKMRTARPDNAPAKTGDVKLGNGGGYRKGGAAKKFAEGGRVQDDGGPEQMKQGRKPMPAPVAITALSGAYKKGGKVAPNNAKLQAFNNAEFAPTMKAAKKDSNEKYGPARNFMMPKKAGGAC